MQLVTWILVYAKDPESAKGEALRVIHKKWEEGVYDWAVDFTENGFPKYHGKDGLGSTPAVLQVSSARFPIDDKRGVEMAYFAMEANRSEFKKNMGIIRQEIAKYDDDSLFESKCGSKFRNYCQYVGEDIEEPYVHLYDFLGNRVTSPSILQRILNDTYSSPFYKYEGVKHDPYWVWQLWNRKLWIVPYFVHW
jgi:hypothetical protein